MPGGFVGGEGVAEDLPPDGRRLEVHRLAKAERRGCHEGENAVQHAKLRFRKRVAGLAGGRMGRFEPGAARRSLPGQRWRLPEIQKSGLLRSTGKIGLIPWGARLCAASGAGEEKRLFRRVGFSGRILKAVCPPAAERTENDRAIYLCDSPGD